MPDGLSEAQRDNLAAASAAIDEITCSTIHGFCQRLIKPYPVEADIDPGASVMDRNQADLAFIEIVETWLREQLSGDEGGIIAEMVLQDPGETVGLIHKIVEQPAPPAHGDGAARRRRWRRSSDGLPAGAAAFAAFMRTAPAVEPETADDRRAVRGNGDARWQPAPTAETPAGLVRLLLSRPHPDLCTKAGSFRAYKKKGKWADAAKRAGLAKADGERLNTAAEGHYAACCEAWTALLQAAASRVLADLDRRSAAGAGSLPRPQALGALLDFDDLIFAARDLLRDHDEVRRALAARFAHVLVDEFQDTDPLQTEIFWRLCGDRPPDGR